MDVCLKHQAIKDDGICWYCIKLDIEPFEFKDKDDRLWNELNG